MRRRCARTNRVKRATAWRCGLLGLLLALAGPAWLAPADGVLASPRHRHDVSPQIINGHPVDPGQDRFVVALLDTARGSTQFDQQFCGGSVIGRQYILTAAHCLERPHLVSHLSVLIDQGELDGGGGVVIKVKRAQIDPHFHPSSIQNDAAVLTLAQEIPLPRSQPIALVGAGDGALTQAGDPAAVAGWGNTSTSGNDFPTQLMQAEVAIVADRDCAAAYHRAFHPGSMVCAAGNAPSRDSCQGDSGGPLFADANAAQPVQIGIVSWGNGCAQPGFPGVYTRLSDPAIAAWIQHVMSTHPHKQRRG